MSEYINEDGVSFVPGKMEVTESMNVPALIRRRGQEMPKKVACQRKSSMGNQWISITWAQFIDEIRALARGFIAYGLKPGDRVAIMARTSYEWSLFDFAIQFAGGYAVPIYETSVVEQAEWIIEDAGCRFVVVENQAMEMMLQPVLERQPVLEKIFVINDDAQGRITSAGSLEDDSEIDRRIDAQKADDVWTIIYTSGTTGRPKGVVLTHRNLLHVVLNGPADSGLIDVLSRKDSATLLFLPMAHVFARFINVVALYASVRVGYCPDTKNLVSDMQSFRPTFVLAVPRVFEKIYNAADAKAGKGAKLKIFRTAAKVAINYARALETEEGPTKRQELQHSMFDKLVYSTIRDIMGGRVRYAISGGAPLGNRLAAFFTGAGITLLEGYGLSETSAPTTVNRTNKSRLGSVGPAYPGCYVKAAEDGELLVKGDHVFKEYHKNPEATAEAFTEDGWFRTGDIGRVDEDDFVWVTGRKKEIIVTAGGKNVAPAELEDRLRSHPIISQVVVVGDKKPFISALVTIDAEALPQYLANRGLPAMSATEAVNDPQIIAAIDRAIKRTNTHVSRAESIRKFEILPGDFTVENGYLTPSLKVKRSEVLKDYADVIEKIYAQ
ncbi:AMP-dependent synthetase/ligase [Trueperella bialowiezensis]|uniref:Acyl-CoA synthetase n=1 Tax=Trueperella bialowiezensis TaxID=312285 RepID=A0A3S5EVZ1_9ACTO|nr:long-chain fatty acid--CoA ligase [Trueperella bialowiezensis]VEI12713.1 Long-chain-fatty-acid--CoA ligase FadD15 [Trueperella bialowiezensis]